MTPFYPSHISDAGLQKLLAYYDRYYDTAPAILGWIRDMVNAERYRRLAVNQGIEEPPQVLDSIPDEWLRWSNDDLAEALTFITVTSYSIGEMTAKDFVDHLVIIVGSFACHRLREKEPCLQ